MSNSIEASRDEFEAEATEYGLNIQTADDRYVWTEAVVAWRFWQAAKAAPASEAVPVIDRWRDFYWRVAKDLNCLPSTFTTDDAQAHVFRAARRYAALACKMCNGHGLVGGMTRDGMDGDTCLDCQGTGCAHPPQPQSAVVQVEPATKSAEICDAEAAKWRKEAQKHLPHWNSDHARRDIARAEICEGLAKKIRLTAQAKPSDGAVQVEAVTDDEIRTVIYTGAHGRGDGGAVTLKSLRANMRFALEQFLAARTKPADVGAVSHDPAMRYPGPWRVGLFWSSSEPTKKVRCLAESRDTIAEYEKRKDFIEWLSPPAPAQQLSVTKGGAA